MNNYDSIPIHGIRIDVLNIKDFLSAMEKQLSDGTSPLCVFTPNAEMICETSHDDTLMSIVNSSDINIADGISTVWAAKKLGKELPCRIPGIDAGYETMKTVAKYNKKVYLLGGNKSIAEKAAKNLQKQIQNLSISGFHDGYFNVNDQENDTIIEDINNSDAELLIVCMGFPRQESWIYNNKDKLTNVRIIMGLGGSVDIWSGNKHRAPILWQKTGMEWLWRLLSEPQRIGRYLKLPEFVKLINNDAKILKSNT